MRDVLDERHGPLEHVPRDGLGGEPGVLDPGCPAPVGLQGAGQQLVEGLGVGDVLEQRHALLVLDPVGLHRGDGFAAGLVLLGVEDLAGVVERRLDHRQHVHRIAGRLAVQQVDRGERERGERLVEREVELEVADDADPAALGVGLGQLLHHARRAQRPVDRDRAQDVAALAVPRLVVVLQQVAHGGEGVPRPGDDVEQHRVAHPEVAGERFGLRALQLLEAHVGPADEALRRLLAHDPLALLEVVARPREQPCVLHLVVGCLGDDGADGVVARAPRPAGDLVELAGLERAGALAVVLGQGGEQHGADRHVDADAEGVGAADDAQQPGLGEGLHQPPVAGEHPAWCTPMPWRTSRERVLPNPEVNRNRPMCRRSPACPPSR